MAEHNNNNLGNNVNNQFINPPGVEEGNEGEWAQELDLLDQQMAIHGLLMMLQNNQDRNTQEFKDRWTSFRPFLLQFERLNDGTFTPLTQTLRTGAIRAVAAFLRLEKIYQPDDVNEVVMNVAEIACTWHDHLDLIFSEDLISKIVEFIEGAKELELDSHSVFLAFNALNNLATIEQTRSALLAARVPELCSQFWNGPSEYRGLSLLCKLFGKYEDGTAIAHMSAHMDRLEDYVSYLVHVAKIYPLMVDDRAWDPVEMMNDVLLVATSDFHKPRLCFVLPKIVEILEDDNSRPQLLSKCVLVLSQLLFEPSLEPEFVRFKHRLEERLGTITPSDVEVSRELVLLRRRLDDLKSTTEHSFTETKSMHFPTEPTFVFIYSMNPSAAPICETIVAKLQNEGYHASFRTQPLDSEFVQESYAGAIIMEPLYFVDFTDFSNSSRYAYHERCMQERYCVMEDMWDLLINYNDKWDLVQQILARAHNFEIPLDPRGHPRLIKMVLFDIAERHTSLYPHYPVESIDDYDAPAQIPLHSNDIIEESGHPDMSNEVVLALINEMAGKMVELQGEIHRLTLELNEARASLPEYGPAEKPSD